MERTPDTPHTLIRALNLLPDPLVHLTTRVSQQLRLQQNLLHLHIPHTYSLFLSIDVMTSNHRMRMWSRRDVDFDTGIRAGEAWEDVFEEGVHALGGPGPVGVVEVEAAEGEDECGKAVL
jgi:hypothetical protein